MRTQVGALYESAKDKYHLTLHAGSEGLSNSASWVYLAEDIQNAPFLKGGEFAITTGLFTQNGVSLAYFIQTLAASNCSGILLNLGPYLTEADLTPALLAFCNRNHLPLMTMPWEVHLVDIMQVLCARLLQDSQQDSNLSAALQGLLYQARLPDSTARILEQCGFPPEADYRVIVIRNLTDQTRISSPLNGFGMKYHLFPHDNLHVLLYDTAQEGDQLSRLIDTICFCDSIVLGISGKAHGLAEVYEQYKRARFALAAAHFWGRTNVNFEQMGIFQLLFCTSDTALLRALADDYLSVLEQYDSAHSTEYLMTLRAFLLCDCNLQDTAARLHTHRNTIVYRMKKIKELTGRTLESASEKFDLLMAFYMREYLLI